MSLPSAWQRDLLRASYERFAKDHPKLKIMLCTYFGGQGENFDAVMDLPVAGMHLAGTRCGSEVAQVTDRLTDEQVLSIGIIHGRNVWKTDLQVADSRLKPTLSKLGADRLIVAPSCSLLHVPVSLKTRRSWLPNSRIGSLSLTRSC